MASEEEDRRNLGELLAHHLRLHRLAPSSCARYDLSARNLARFLGGPIAKPSDILLDRLEPELMLDFRDWSLLRLRPVSFNTERRHLSSLFNSGVRSGWMASNPFKDVPTVRAPKALPKSLPKADMRAYLGFLQSAHRIDANGARQDLLPPQWFWSTLVAVYYYTGMRRRQIVGLRWEDLSFTEMTVKLSAGTSKNLREWLVPLPQEIVNELLFLRNRTIEITGPEIGPRQVFCLPLFSAWEKNFARREMNKYNVDAFFKRLRRCAPPHLPKLSSHRIRHTTATVLANAVPNLRLVQEQLGHTSIATTFGYVHPDLAAMRRALTAL